MLVLKCKTSSLNRPWADWSLVIIMRAEWTACACLVTNYPHFSINEAILGMWKENRKWREKSTAVEVGSMGTLALAIGIHLATPASLRPIHFCCCQWKLYKMVSNVKWTEIDGRTKKNGTQFALAFVPDFFSYNLAVNFEFFGVWECLNLNGTILRYETCTIMIVLSWERKKHCSKAFDHIWTWMSTWHIYLGHSWTCEVISEERKQGTTGDFTYLICPSQH
jgi:hypothetical protein